MIYLKVLLANKEVEKMKKNYKLQNTNYKQITNYNAQNYKCQPCHITQHPNTHHPITPFPHYPKSLSQLTSFPHLPIFPASQLPSFPPGPRRDQ